MIELKKIGLRISLLFFSMILGFSAFSQYLPVEESVAKIEAAAELIKWGSDSPIYVKQNKKLDYIDKLEAIKLSIADQLINVIIAENSSE
jgi:DNA invertase Pin-like site-specific DNA recombinase